MICKKCNNDGSVILRKTDSYCIDCFTTNTNHKFRACIGKNKILSKNERVLVCLSGGLSSTVILDLIHNGISMDNHKKLRITPFFLHVLEMTNNSKVVAENVIKQCENYNFQVYVIHISQYMESDIDLCSYNEIPNANNIDKFSSLLNSMPSTARNDLILKIKKNLFVKCAEKLECHFIFTAEASTTLAINLLSSITLGRGSQVENEVGFCDVRDENVKILRPMRDLSQEELSHYIGIKKLQRVQSSHETNDNSIQSVIGQFVSDLQENFSATISTVCKTADKISVLDDHENRGKCIICESGLGTPNSRLTAFEATTFSRATSYRIPENSEDQSLFPFIHKSLCYACSRNYSEMDKNSIPDHVNKLL